MAHYRRLLLAPGESFVALQAFNFLSTRNHEINELHHQVAWHQTAADTSSVVSLYVAIAVCPVTRPHDVTRWLVLLDKGRERSSTTDNVK